MEEYKILRLAGFIRDAFDAGRSYVIVVAEYKVQDEDCIDELPILTQLIQDEDAIERVLRSFPSRYPGDEKFELDWIFADDGLGGRTAPASPRLELPRWWKLGSNAMEPWTWEGEQ